MELDLDKLRQLVSATFGEEAAADQDIVSFYEDVLKSTIEHKLFKTTYVVKSFFGEYNSCSNVISVSFDLKIAIENKNNFENQMAIQRRVPAPFGINPNDIKPLEGMSDDKITEYSNWFSEKSEADEFIGCTITVFETDKLYSQNEPSQEEEEESKTIPEPTEGTPKYLVRPSDFTVFVKLENGAYVVKETHESEAPYMCHENSYEVLTGYDFFPCTEEEFPALKEKQNFYYGFNSWQSRSDGHGGSKGGTLHEYKQFLKRVEKFNRLNDEK
jgi:hypothetical protein